MHFLGASPAHYVFYHINPVEIENGCGWRMERARVAAGRLWRPDQFQFLSVSVRRGSGCAAGGMVPSSGKQTLYSGLHYAFRTRRRSVCWDEVNAEAGGMKKEGCCQRRTTVETQSAAFFCFFFPRTFSSLTASRGESRTTRLRWTRRERETERFLGKTWNSSF